jgi:NAD(P)H-dependent flavin oxidoreductase YrpB (nitropropane dioxygenase family)
MPFRLVLESVVTYGKRHVMMGATQIDREGNQNISAIGAWAQPTRQLLGVRGAPGNTVNNKTSYWVPKHSSRVFVDHVDIVSGVGRTRAEAAGTAATRFHQVHRVVSDLGVFDFEGPGHTMRILSVHPGVTVEDVHAASSFRIEQLLRTPLTELAGVRHPVVQTGMGWVAGPRLVVGTANAGGLGILASATMSYDELEHAITEVKSRTDQPFGVNLRADAADAPDRVNLLIEHGVKVASFALAPKKELIAKLKDHGIMVMPSVGAPRHAEKVAGWGADAVMIQGGEGGGHTGNVPTTLLLPTVLDAVDIPVVAAGGFFDGRGLAAALAYGAAGVGMGTRFLLTQDSTVPDAVKQRYLQADLDGTVVTANVDGMPHRMLRTELVEEVEETSGVKRLVPTARRTLEFKRMSGMSWRQLAVDGRAMRKEQGRTLAQMTMAANTPMMLKAGLVDGDTGAGVLASGQVVGVINDLPTCDELITRVVTEAAECLRRTSGLLA